MAKKIEIYSSPFCPFCTRAKMLLDKKGAKYQEIRVDKNPAKKEEMIKRSKRRTVPQIYIGDFHVGGCDELFDLERKGKLNQLLAD